MRLCTAMCGYLLLFEDIRGHARLCAVMGDYMQLCEAIRGYARLCEAMFYYVRLWKHGRMEHGTWPET